MDYNNNSLNRLSVKMSLYASSVMNYGKSRKTYHHAGIDCVGNLSRDNYSSRRKR